MSDASKLKCWLGSTRGSGDSRDVSRDRDGDGGDADRGLGVGREKARSSLGCSGTSARGCDVGDVGG